MNVNCRSWVAVLLEWRLDGESGRAQVECDGKKCKAGTSRGHLATPTSPSHLATLP